MNTYVKNFFLRGLMFGGFGPIVLGIVYAILQATVVDFSLTGGQVLLAIISTYLLAFLQAGATVFNQIDHWPLAKSLLCHFTTLYAAYTLCYIGNTWIPFDPTVLLIFTAIFVGGYFLIWGIVLLCVKAVSKRMNQKLG